MNTEELAQLIYARVITERILMAPKVWAVPEKQARGIARAALDASEIFMDESLKAQNVDLP